MKIQFLESMYSPIQYLNSWWETIFLTIFGIYLGRGNENMSSQVRVMIWNQCYFELETLDFEFSSLYKNMPSSILW